MKKKILFSILLSFISHASFSYHGKDFQVINETVEQSSKVHGGIIENPREGSKPTFFAQAGSLTRDVKGQIYETVYLRANHSVNIANHTNKPQTYVYQYELNCDGQYYRKKDTILVQPGGYAINNHDSFMFTSKINPGQFKINAITDIKGESSSNNIATATLTITR